MATYGEGEPTDNAVQLMQNLSDESFEFSGGERKLEGLKYVVFALGNKTYEHYNLIGRKVDSTLTEMGAIRCGERGEGDDDKSMEEDYLEWKDAMWEDFARKMGVEEGQGGDTADFAVSELDSHPSEKVYLGRSPLPASVSFVNELLQVNFPPALLPRPRVFTTLRIHIPHLSSLRVNFSKSVVTGTAFMLNLVLKVLESRINMVTTLVFGQPTPRWKSTVSFVLSASRRRRTKSLALNLWTLPLPRFLSLSQPPTSPFSVTTSISALSPVVRSLDTYPSSRLRQRQKLTCVP